jgi:hypothetical protein
MPVRASLRSVRISFRSLRAANLNSSGVSGVGLAVGVGLSLGESVASGVGETDNEGDGEGVASLVEVLESVAEEIIPEITIAVMIAALCQGFRDINLPHKFFNILASSNLHKISD